MNAPGEIQVLLKRGVNLRNTSFLLSKQDPYAILDIGSSRKRSRVDHNAGRNPVWNDRFSFSVNGTESEMKVTIFDKDGISNDDFIGMGRLSLAPLFVNRALEAAIPISGPKGQWAGEVFVTLTFVPNHMQQGYGSPAAYGAAAPYGQHAQPGYGYPPAPQPAYPTSGGYPPAGGAYPPAGAPFAPQPSYPAAGAPSPYPPAGGYPPAAPGGGFGGYPQQGGYPPAGGAAPYAFGGYSPTIAPPGYPPAVGNPYSYY